MDVQPQTDLKAYADRLEVLCRAQADEIGRLRQDNERLRSEKSDALSVLREVYNDPNASPAHRIKAAGLALPHEVPRLEPVPAPMELVAEVIEPLADVVARQRARADWMLENDPQFVALAKYEASQRRILGDGSDDSDND